MANAVLAAPAERTDHQLVSAVRGGDDRAFEALYARYQRRIGAYVFGMVKDHGRAEDITQEVFVSALRRMRQTERPIAFKAWVYEIAKNACIDAYRRGSRAEEVSFDADDRLSPSDHVRLVASGPEPDAAVDAKQELDHLRGAFGGLSDSHHEILVLRELEGRSYKDIGERMGMTRPAVESTLFRARKRLGEEYDELASGARCLRVQGIIAEEGARLGLRDRRKLARHVSHCQPCRRLAAQAGVEIPLPARRRIADKIAGLLPLPAFLRRGRGGDEATGAVGGGGGGWMTHAPLIAESMSSGWGKGVAGLAALVLAGAGASTVTLPDSRDDRGVGAGAIDARTAGQAAGGATRRPSAEVGKRAGKAVSDVDRRRGGDAARPGKGGDGAARQRAAGGGTGATDAPAGSAPADANAPSGSAPGKGGGPLDAAPKAPVDVPAVQAPNVKDTTDAVSDPLPAVEDTVESTAPELPVDPPDVPEVPQLPAPVADPVEEVTGGVTLP